MLALPRAQQPQGPVTLAPRYGAASVALLPTQDGGFRNLGRRAPARFTNNGTTLEARRDGLARALAGASGYLVGDWPDQQPPSVWTFVAAVDLPNPTADNAIVTYAQDAGSSVADRGLIVRSGGVEGYIYDGAERVATGAANARAGFNAFAVRCTGAELQVWTNGAAGTAQAVSNGGYTSYPSSKVVIGYGGGNGTEFNIRPSSARLLALAVFESALPAPELVSLTLNPWQLFAPEPRRLWAMAPAAAGTPRRMTLLGVG